MGGVDVNYPSVSCKNIFRYRPLDSRDPGGCTIIIILPHVKMYSLDSPDPFKQSHGTNGDNNNDDNNHFVCHV